MTQRDKGFKQFSRRWGPHILSIVALAVMLWYLKRSSLLAELDFRTIRWGYFALVVLAEAAIFGLLGAMLAVFVAQAGISMRFIEWYGLSITSNISNIIVPISGGMMARAGYLKARYNFPVSRFTALLAVGYLVIFLVGGLSGLSILIVRSLLGGYAISWIVAGALGGMTVAPIIIIMVPLERLPLSGESRIMQWIRSALDGWREVRTDLPLLVKQMGLVGLLQLAQAASLYFGLRGLGKPIPFSDTLLIGVLTNLTNFVRITPGALGVREAVAGVATELVGFNAAQGISAALVTRLAKWSVAFVLGPIFAFFLVRYAQEPVVTAPANGEEWESGEEDQDGADPLG